MPRVKIIWIERFQLDEYDSKEVVRLIEPGEFEEISEEELTQLRQNLHALPRPNYNFEPRILILDSESFSTRMDVIRQVVGKAKVARELAERKREEAKKARKMSTLQRKKAQFAQLKAELGV